MAVERKSPSRNKGKDKEQLEDNKASKPQVDAHVQTPTKKESNMSDEVKSLIEYEDDLENAEAPPLLPKGDYPAEIRAAERKSSKSKEGSEYVQVQFYISPDDYPADADDLDPDGVVLSYMRLNPANTVKARFGMKKFVSAIGGTLGKTLDLNDWIGKTAIITVDHEPYDGQNQMVIRKVTGA